MNTTHLVTYHETLTPLDGHIELTEGAEIQVLEVHRMGPDLNWRYVLRVPVDSDA